MQQPWILDTIFYDRDKKYMYDFLTYMIDSVLTVLKTYRANDITLLLPFAFVLLMTFSHLIQIVISLVKAMKDSLTTSNIEREVADAENISVENRIEYLGGQRIFSFLVARLLGCLTLLGLSGYSLVISIHEQTHPPNDTAGILFVHPEFCMFITYVSPCDIIRSYVILTKSALLLHFSCCIHIASAMEHTRDQI